MKKNLAVFVAFVVVLVIFLCFLEGDEFVQKCSLYHNKGQIELSVNGKNVKLNGVEIQLKTDDGERVERTIIRSEKFRFRGAEYGERKIEFKIPKELLPDKKSVKVCVNSFSSDWWQVINYKLKINLTYSNDHINTKTILKTWIHKDKNDSDRTVDEKILEADRVIRTDESRHWY